MQQPAAFFVCGQCDAGYDSASSLNAHKSRSHCGSCSDQRLHPQNGAWERSPNFNPDSGPRPMTKLTRPIYSVEDSTVP
jgi:hypothetical protein